MEIVKKRLRSDAAWMIVAAVAASAGLIGIDAVRAAASGADNVKLAGDSKHVEAAEVERTVEGLGLSDAQKRAVAPMVEGYRQKERQARQELLVKMKGVLTSGQYQELAGVLNAAPDRVGAATTGTAGVSQVAITFRGGFETDPRDGGRPVVLVAGALKVSPEVFREAFSGVTPAAGGRQPEAGQVRRNKDALLRVLAPYGVTNDRLDEVSDYYRYQPGRGDLWRHSPARAVANVRDGVVTGFTILDPGSGYSSAPKVSVAGMPGAKAEVKLSYGADFKRNGSVQAIVIIDPK